MLILFVKDLCVGKLVKIKKNFNYVPNTFLLDTKPVNGQQTKRQKMLLATDYLELFMLIQDSAHKSFDGISLVSA